MSGYGPSQLKAIAIGLLGLSILSGFVALIALFFSAPATEEIALTALSVAAFGEILWGFAAWKDAAGTDTQRGERASVALAGALGFNLGYAAALVSRDPIVTLSVSVGVTFFAWCVFATVGLMHPD